MSASTVSGRPWIVQTTKRTADTGEPYRKKRQRLSLHDGTLRKPRQQTLTQAQFAPRATSPLYHYQMEPIEMGAESKKALSRTSKKPKLPRTRKGLKTQRSTLTQMDFLASHRHDNGGGHEELEMILIEAAGKGNIVDGKENVNPNPPKPDARAKGMVTAPVTETVDQSRKRRRKASGSQASYSPGWHGRSPRSTYQSGVHGTVLADRKPDRRVANAGAVSFPETRQASRKKDRGQLEAEPGGRIPSDGTAKTHSNHRAAVPETPKRRGDIIPSSQSPENVSTSSRKRPSWLHGMVQTSPLKKRRTNAPSRESPARRKLRGSSAVKNGLSPKSKVCMLKYGPGRMREAELKDLISGRPQTPNSRPQQLPAMDNIVSCSEVVEMDKSALDTPGDTGPETSETSQVVQPGFVLSSQTDDDGEEDEIPETSQGLRRVTSTSSLNKSEESLLMLSNKGKTPPTVKKIHAREDLGQCDLVLLDVESQVHNLTSRDTDGRLDPKQDTPNPPPTVDDFESTSQELYESATHQKRPVCTIADSQDEDYDDDDISFGFPASIANNEKIPSSPTRPLPKSPVAISGLIPAPTPDDTPSSARPSPAPSPTSFPPAAITRVPTKLPSSSSADASPSLPRLAPPKPAPPPSTTEQSIHPASMIRPSQVSTQAGTQMSWFPTSSMPTPDTAATTSPSHGNGIEHIPIKDSSSMPTSLGVIPSQPPSQAVALETMAHGLGIDMHLEDGYLDRDEDLDPKSSPPTQHPLPARLQLPESMLESLPGPPGWVPPPPASSSTQSQWKRDQDQDQGWDDKML